MREGVSQERTHLDPMSREDTLRLVRRGYTSILCQERIHLDPMSGEDTPRSYVRRGYASILCQERIRLDPMSGEDSGHASILCQERTVDTPRPWSREGTPHPISGEDSSYVRGQ